MTPDGHYGILVAMEDTPAWIERLDIRLAQEADLKALEWDGQFAHFRRMYAHAFRRMQQGNGAIWVVELPGASVIGQVFLQFNCDRPELADGKDRAYLYSFRVKPKYRGAGVGTRLLAAVENDLRLRGFSALTLNVARDNYDAMRFYDRHGFRIVAEEPGIWDYQDEHGNWQHVEEPAWRMEKKLVSSS